MTHISKDAQINVDRNFLASTYLQKQAHTYTSSPCSQPRCLLCIKQLLDQNCKLVLDNFTPSHLSNVTEDSGHGSQNPPRTV